MSSCFTSNGQRLLETLIAAEKPITLRCAGYRSGLRELAIASARRELAQAGAIVVERVQHSIGRTRYCGALLRVAGAACDVPETQGEGEAEAPPPGVGSLDASIRAGRADSVVCLCVTISEGPSPVREGDAG